MAIREQAHLLPELVQGHVPQQVSASSEPEAARAVRVRRPEYRLDPRDVQDWYWLGLGSRPKHQLAADWCSWRP